MADFSGFSSLRVKDYRLFWLGQLVSLSGTWMQSVAQGWLVYSLTKSPFYLGLVAAAGSLPILLFTFAG
ncbi:MAG: MFS transporter, partial [Nitrospirota bacterium]